MRLLEKNNRSFFRLAIFLLLVGGLLFFFSTRFIIREELDEKLWVNHARIIEQISKQQSIPQLAPLIEVQTFSKPVTKTVVFKDTLIFDPIEQELEAFRQLVAATTIDGLSYQIAIRTSLVEAEDLLEVIGISMTILLLLLLVGLYWLNHRNTVKLWLPFQQNLTLLKKYSLSNPSKTSFVKSEVQEFEELRTALQQLTEKVQSDYQNLKDFTENASHEMQTPLAIIRSKVEELIEQEGLSQEQSKAIEHINQATNRLSGLNQNLLLLAKIENQQFQDVEIVSFNELIGKELSWLSDLIEARQLNIQLEEHEILPIAMSQTLAEVLIKNLLENAIRFTPSSGTILITIKNQEFSFFNSGEQPLPKPEQLFERFYQYGNNGNSTGLGLAIVKQIAEVYNFNVHYSFHDKLHEFKVKFKIIS